MTTSERLRRKLERANPCPVCELGSLMQDRSERGNKRRCHLCAWGGPTRRAARSDMEDLARDAPRMTVTVAEANRMRYRARDLEQQGLSTSQIAKAIGRSKSTVAGYLVGVENESQRDRALDLQQRGWSQREIARAIGKSRAVVAAYLTAA